MKRYVLGFHFTTQRDGVVLIFKTKGPRAVVGRWNGLGGKVEPGEAPTRAMIREYQEEAGLTLDWSAVGVMNFEDCEVHVFRCFSDQEPRQMEEEPVRLHMLAGLPDVVPNLRWLLPLCLDEEIQEFGVTT